MGLGGDLTEIWNRGSNVVRNVSEHGSRGLLLGEEETFSEGGGKGTYVSTGTPIHGGMGILPEEGPYVPSAGGGGSEGLFGKISDPSYMGTPGLPPPPTSVLESPEMSSSSTAPTPVIVPAIITPAIINSGATRMAPPTHSPNVPTIVSVPTPTPSSGKRHIVLREPGGTSTAINVSKMSAPGATSAILPMTVASPVAPPTTSISTSTGGMKPPGMM